MYAGPSAFSRLTVYTKLRTRQALLYSKPSLVFLCAACGEDDKLFDKTHGGGDGGRNNNNISINGNALATNTTTSSVEPPVAVVLGDSGGIGLVSTVVQEVFTTLPHLNMASKGYSKNAGGHVVNTFPKKNKHANAATNLDATRVMMQAVVLLDDSSVVDLLCSNQNIDSRLNTCGVRKVQGKTVIVNATQIQLKKATDFERIVGVIFGRRTAMGAFLAALASSSAYQSSSASVSSGSSPGGVRNSDGEAVLLDHLASSPWLIPNKTATLLITVSVYNNKSVYGSSSTYIASGRGKQTDFHFVCPCGQQWSTPGNSAVQ